MAWTPEQRKEYYLSNKDKWKVYNANQDKEKLAEYQKQYRKDNRALVSKKSKDKKELRLITAIEMLGGCCSRCNGVFPTCVYDFHHIRDKEFTISENMLIGKDRFFKEINKCVLLCANCHRLEHNKKE